MTTQELFQSLDMKGHADCWEWKHSRDKYGYGMAYFNSRRNYTHRIAFTLLVGPIPAGMLVCHKCDNPPCCNPAHLFVGTVKDNTLDRNAKGRAPRQDGERNGNAALGPSAVAKIRALAASGVKQTHIATMFGVSSQAVSLIVTGKRWLKV